VISQKELNDIKIDVVFGTLIIFLTPVVFPTDCVPLLFGTNRLKAIATGNNENCDCVI